MSPRNDIKSLTKTSLDKNPLSFAFTCEARKTWKYGLLATDVSRLCGSEAFQNASESSPSSFSFKYSSNGLCDICLISKSNKLSGEPE